MTELFSLSHSDRKLNYNIDISQWNVSNVEYMDEMFYHYEQFNCDLSNWNVSNVENMRGMFEGCTNFNGNISNWNVSNVENMESMFKGCANFNGNISNWNVSNVENGESMFERCINFNQDLSRWNVKKMEYMDCMFKGCKNLINTDFSKWHVYEHYNYRRDKVDGPKTMAMFRGCDKMQKSLKYKPYFIDDEDCDAYYYYDSQDNSLESDTFSWGSDWGSDT